MKKDRNICALEQHQCIVCGTVFETGSLILDRKLNRGFKDQYVVTGYGLCEHCKKVATDNNGIWLAEHGGYRRVCIKKEALNLSEAQEKHCKDSPVFMMTSEDMDALGVEK
ncbi:MAG: hypothetical protein ACI4S2_06660 [Lachnospiraceae bacterium]